MAMLTFAISSLTVFCTFFAIAHSINSSNITWVDCSQNVPNIFDSTGVDLANLPPTLHCGQIEVPLDYAKPLGVSNKIILGLAMYRPERPKGVIF